MSNQKRKRTARTNWDAVLAHLQWVAHEGHMMGRVYQNGGEILKPGEEWQRVDDMCKRYLATKRKEARRLTKRRTP